MLIGIDANEANIQNRVGAGQYAYNLLTALYQLDSQNHYYIYLKSQPLPDLPSPKKNWHYRVFGPQKLWTKFALPLHLYTNGIKLDLFYSLTHYSPHFSPFPTIPTIHDLGYLDTQDQFTPKDLHQLIHWTLHSLKIASHVIAVSEFTRQEINRIYHLPLSKITVAPNGVGDTPKVTDKSIQKVLSHFHIKKPYFLYLGTLKPNKNIPFLVKSFSLFSREHPDYSLVIAGKKGWLFDEIFSTVTHHHLENKVIFTDYINENDKWPLIKAATAFILPSTYEGFGIPAIEAMKMDTPVIASSIPAFKEVVGNAGLFVDPNDTQDLVTKMNEIIKADIRKKLISLGTKQCQKYTWANSAQQVLKAFSIIKSCSTAPEKI